MDCTRCGQPIAPGARFCGNCGTAAGTTPVESTPTWLRLAGIGSAALVLAALVVLVLGSETEDVIGDVIAGEWDCDLRDDAQDDAEDWDVEFSADGRVEVDAGELSADGEWAYEDGRLSLDFPDTTLTEDPTIVTQSVHLDSLDELEIRGERTGDDEDDGTRATTATCERSS